METKHKCPTTPVVHDATATRTIGRQSNLQHPQKFHVSTREDLIIWKVKDKAYSTSNMYKSLNTTNNANEYWWAFI